MASKKKLLLWDADYLAFKHKKDSTLQEAIENVDKHILEVLKFSKCSYFSMHLSGGKYFRHDLAKEAGSETLYKANRGKTTQPWIKAIKAYLEQRYGATYGDGWEADDSLGFIHSKQFNYYPVFTENVAGLDISTTEHIEWGDLIEGKDGEIIETILCSCDKDILNSFKGKNLNPSKKTGDNLWEPVWIETNFDDANEWKIFQLIGGDVGDNVKTKFPESCGLFNCKLSIPEVLHGYIYGFHYETPKGTKKFIEGYGINQGIFEFSKNFRLLHILRTTEDFMREIGSVPKFPTIINVKDLNIESDEPEEIKIEF